GGVPPRLGTADRLGSWVFGGGATGARSKTGGCVGTLSGTVGAARRRVLASGRAAAPSARVARATARRPPLLKQGRCQPERASLTPGRPAPRRRSHALP